MVIPTAMPELPFTRRFGNRVGNTSGSLVESSKFGPKSTVSLSMSASIASASSVIRDSV